MRDDDLPEFENDAVRRTVRSDDVPSSVPSNGLAETGRPGRATPWAVVLGVLAWLGSAAGRGRALLGPPARRGLDPLRAAARPGAARLRAAVIRVRAHAPRLRRAAAALLAWARRWATFRTCEALVRRWAAPAAVHARRFGARTAVLAARAGLGQRRGGHPAWYAAAAGVLCCLGLVAAVTSGAGSADPTADPTAATAPNPDDRVALSRPDQSNGGAAAGGKAEKRAGTGAGSATPEADDPGQSPPLVDSGPVAGLTQVQMDNARAIVRTGRDMGMPRRALVIGVATAMQESNLLNRASEVVPESKRYPHQGTGWDHDSVGLFQQRSSSGWGPVNRLMDPAYATARFFEALRRVPGWQRMRLTEAAQAVQVSAYPEHYAKHEGNATEVVDALVPRLH
ncbi:hypothetical protein [Plantactinospora sonchi]|uniref:Peptidase M23 n=1 Tax=Plantactinospora sonchi TaxID=1544735 RepID=A0ABU7RRJ9_9ACTN